MTKPAQISPQMLPCDTEYKKAIRSQPCEDMAANNGILHPIELSITVQTAGEALKFFKMGYLSAATLKEAGVAITNYPEKGSEAYNIIQRMDIQSAIEQWFGYSPEQLKEKCRKRGLVLPRHLTLYMLSMRTTWKQARIAALYNLDRTAVIHGRETIKRYLTQKGYSEEKELLTDFINNYNLEHD